MRKTKEDKMVYSGKGLIFVRSICLISEIDEMSVLPVDSNSNEMNLFLTAKIIL
jgi:hypothetical protein